MGEVVEGLDGQVGGQGPQPGACISLLAPWTLSSPVASFWSPPPHPRGVLGEDGQLVPGSERGAQSPAPPPNPASTETSRFAAPGIPSLSSTQLGPHVGPGLGASGQGVPRRLGPSIWFYF